MKKVISLIRVSTEGQAGQDRAGIPAQREANHRTAQTYGLEIVKTIEIVDVSGTSVLLSSEMQDLVHLMGLPEIHGVLAREFSRLIRPERFTDYALLQAFIDTNTVLYLPDGPIDLASKSGRLLGTIRAAIAGLERREILDRMQDAKESMRRAGKHPGGPTSLPYGVGYSKERGWYYTAEAQKVKDAFALFLSGQTSYSLIGQKLNIARTSLRFMLQNRIYTGWKIYDQKRDPSTSGYVPGPNGRQGYRRKIKRRDEEVVRVQVLEALVTEEEFARTQELINLKSLKHWRTRCEAPNRYTFNGFLVCADCESPLYTHTSKHDFYLCKTKNTRERRKREVRGLGPCRNRYMLRTKLEAKINCLLGERLREKSFLVQILNDYQKLLDESVNRAPIDQVAISAKLTDLIMKKERILDAFFEGVLDTLERDRRLTQLQNEVDSYERLLIEARKPDPRLTLSDLAQVLEPFSEWEFLAREDKRSLLRVICPEIMVFQYTVHSIALRIGGLASGCDKVSHWRKVTSPSRAPHCR